jgi:hypothetical protein
MRYDYQLSRRDQIGIFLSQFYRFSWLLFVRIFGGPFMVLAGILLYTKEGKALVALGGFLIVFGIYHFFRPLFSILFSPSTFTPLDLSLETSSNLLHYTDGKLASQHRLVKISRFKVEKENIVLWLKQGRKIYIPLKKFQPERQKEIIQYFGNLLPRKR